MARFIALYLPQYHPSPENNEWWGNGFTEWVNVAKARSLFKGHVQPHIPADLGFYDLRMPLIREQQAKLAQEAGIEGFMYYHYYFGNGKQILETPFKEVVESGNPSFPFCLCWANHSWFKKNWNPDAAGKNILLQEQLYPGVEDYKNHFYSLLKAFKDPRYIKVNGKLLFGIYSVNTFNDIQIFIETWRSLAKENGLNDFYFIAQDFDSRNKKEYISKGVDSIFNADIFNIHHHSNILNKIRLHVERTYLKRPTVFEYKKAMKYMINEDCKSRNTIPCIAPNWDHSPRSGTNAIILNNSRPGLFQQLAEEAIFTVKDKPIEEQIVIVKSWNEWGEGNYMEPDLEFGHGWINALKQAIENGKKYNNIKL